MDQKDQLLKNYNILDEKLQERAGKYLQNLARIQRFERKAEKEIKIAAKRRGEDFEGTKDLRRCTFCYRPETMVDRLIAGPERIYICNDCVEICFGILVSAAEEEGKRFSPKMCDYVVSKKEVKADLEEIAETLQGNNQADYISANIDSLIKKYSRTENRGRE